jgi:uncharacterized integral membrane protein (TIGR00698 family)
MGISFAIPIDEAMRVADQLKANGRVVRGRIGVGIAEVWQAGREAVIYTPVGILLTLALGIALGRLFRAAPTTSLLVSFGTAICGGSAIAAMAPVLKAEDEETAVSLATVFSLNAAALLLFPPLGHLLGFSQRQFGLWAALAIHDTSSVVGASAAFGTAALAVGTTVKLARAVWISPAVLLAAWLKKSEGRAPFPYFIAGFIAAAVLRWRLPAAEPLWSGIAQVARQGLVVTLFLVGTGLTRAVLRRVGLRPLALGVLLWGVVSVATVVAILTGLIG